MEDKPEYDFDLKKDICHIRGQLSPVASVRIYLRSGNSFEEEKGGINRLDKNAIALRPDNLSVA